MLKQRPECIWENPNRPELKILRDKFNLEDVVKNGKDEFTKMLLLIEWVHETLPLGYKPKREYKTALEILEDAKDDGEFNCSQYALVFLQCSIALGWHSRKLGIDYNHDYGQEEMHHGITDVWSNQFKKWFVVDAMHNLHFEKDGIPLNAYEVRAEYLKNRAKNVFGIVGNYSKELHYGEDIIGFDQPSNYFWFFILLRNNFFEDPDMYNYKSLLWVDEYNKDRIWYKGGGKKGKSHPHPQYEGQFIKTNDFDSCFPNMAR